LRTYSFFHEKTDSVWGFFNFLRGQKFPILKVMNNKVRIAVKGLTKEKVNKKAPATWLRVLRINIHLL
jgi:hypothetical protein